MTTNVAITGDPSSAFVFHVEGLVTDHMGLRKGPWRSCRRLAALLHPYWT